MDKQLGSSSCKILGTILKMDTSTTKKMITKKRNLMSMHKAWYPKHDIDRQEKNEEKDSPAWKTAWMNQYGDYVKKSKESQIKADINSAENIKINRTTTKTRK